MVDVLRKIVSLAVPASVALAAFLHAHAIGALIDATMSTPASIAPFAEARAASSGATATNTNGDKSKSADAILNRNPFDHSTSLRPAMIAATDDGVSIDGFGDPLSAPPCEGVRAVAAVRSSDPDASFAALNIGGRRTLQKRGEVDSDLRVVYIAEDRVWLARSGKLCQANLFASMTAPPPPPPPPPDSSSSSGGGAAQSPLEKDIASKIVKTGPNEYQVDRGAMNMILEAQTELMRTPLLPEKEGDRVVGFRLVKIKPGSVLSTLGLTTGDRLVSINGIEVTSTERMIEAYAKLRQGTIDRLTIHVVRNGKPTNIDYIVK